MQPFAAAFQKMTFFALLLLRCGAGSSAQAQEASAEEHLRKARELSLQGAWPAAEVEMRQSVQLTPNNAAALAYLGVILTKQEKLEEASEYLGRALTIDSGLTGTRFNLALNQFRLGRPEAAKANLETVLSQRPDHAPAAVLLGTILAQMHRCDKAVALLESVVELTRRQPDSVVALARCYYSSNQRDKAQQALDWLVGHPAGPEAAMAGAEAALQARDFQKAEELLAAIRPSYPDQAKLAYTLAFIQYNAGRFPQCQATLDQLIADGAHDPNVFDLLAWCHHRQQQFPEAARTMNEAIRLEPANGLRYAHLAQILLEEKNYPEASVAAKRAVELAGGGFLAYKVKGDVETSLGMLRQAEISYSRAGELNPLDPEALLLLGISQHNVWKYKEAKVSFERGIRLFPDYARFYLAYGELLLDPAARIVPGGQTTAVSLLEQALAHDSALAEAHYELGKHLVRTGSTGPAVSHLEIAAKLDPRNSQVHLALANAYRVTGHAVAAEEQLQLYKSLRAEGR